MRRWLAAAALVMAVPQVAWAEPCADVRKAVVPAVTITTADEVAADRALVSREGATVPAVGAVFCRVQGHIEDEIGFELWLPASSRWTGRLLAAGVGGEAGTFNLADMARGVRRGYASASTDTGHRLADVDWALGRPDRRANFAARANHLLAEKAKQLVAAYYGSGPRRSYFIGCSGGGREGLKEVQAYPDDFDGVLIGGAGPDQLAVSMRLLWSQYVFGPRIASLVDDPIWARVSAAAIAACDRDDGVADGVIGLPLACRFNPRSLLCPEAGAGCLNAGQLAAVESLYAPLVDENGHAIDRGILPGVRITLAPRSAFAFSLFGKVVHGDANWKPATLNIARDLAAARAAWPDLPNDDTDLARFRVHGGRIIHYHGWMDPWILAQQPIDYHRAVGERLGGADDFYRLYMVPGMGHCRGGAGPDRFGGTGGFDGIRFDPEHDMLAALERWVEQGRAPNAIVAAHMTDAAPAYTRPLCPYPQAAAYRGRGPTNRSSSFLCKKAMP